MRNHMHNIWLFGNLVKAILRGFLPTVLRVGPYRFYFYSHEPNEPPHVHIDRDGFSANFG